MNELQIIEQHEVLGKDFRIYGDFENPLFLARDVAEWIEHSNSRVMLDAVDETEKAVRIVYTLGGNQEAWFLTEDGLYEVLMQSRKPIAKLFKRQVKEILQSVRKHGAYMTPAKIEEVLLNPDTIIRLATELKAERQQCVVLAGQIEEQKPKVIFADAVAASNTTILVGELAKILRQSGVEIGQNRLFEWLRTNGYLTKRKGTDYNIPTQYSMDMGLFSIKETVISHSDGHTSISKTTKVTGKGQIYFINKFKDTGATHILAQTH